MKFRYTLLIDYVIAKFKNKIRFSRGLFLMVSSMYLALSPMGLKAQQALVNEGDRVRLHVPSMQKRPMVGILSSINTHGLVLQSPDSTYFIPHNSVHKFSVSTGKRRHIGKGALIGLFSGAAIGGIVGLISYEECTEVGFMACFMAPENAGQSFALGAILGTIPGSLIGMAIGSAKTDRWEKVPVRMLFNAKPLGTLQPKIKTQMTLRWSIGAKR